MVKPGPGFIQNVSKMIQTNTRSRRILISILILTIWTIIIIPTILSQFLKSGQNLIAYAPSEADPEVILTFSFQSIEVDKRNINLKLNTYTTESTSNKGLPNLNFTCRFFYNQLEVKENETILQKSITIPILYGNARAYPFESLSAFFPIHCEDNKDHNTLIPRIAFDLATEIYQPTFSFANITQMPEEEAASFSAYLDPSFIGVTIALNQPVTSIIFVIFVFLVKWGLSLALLYFTFDVAFSNREVPPPLIGVSYSLLFALPGIRTNQPGVPSLGCLSDYASFFWCMAIVSFCGVLNTFLFALRFKKKVS